MNPQASKLSFGWLVDVINSKWEICVNSILTRKVMVAAGFESEKSN